MDESLVSLLESEIKIVISVLNLTDEEIERTYDPGIQSLSFRKIDDSGLIPLELPNAKNNYFSNNQVSQFDSSGIDMLDFSMRSAKKFNN